MATTYTHDAAEFDSTAVIIGSRAPSAGIVSILKALATRANKARARRVDSEVGAFLEAHGGQLTDDLERQISRRFGTHAGQW